jgi:dihydroorotate dehydrogenase electron transfer subunit
LDKRLAVKILRIEDESENTKTFYLTNKFKDIKPGQFLMITDYESDEKPFSVSDSHKHHLCITVKRIGDFTTRMFKLIEGDQLFCRGMYGNHFTLNGIEDKEVLIVGGGCGTAPLRYLARKLKEKTHRITVINGAVSESEFIFKKVYTYMGLNSINVTDDGSYGEKGTTVDVMREVLKEKAFDMVYLAGPELMMKGALEVLNQYNLPAEFLLERYMKCAIGLCGQCTIDPVGIRLCVEGPVISREMLNQFTEFGNYSRNKAGQRVLFDSDSLCQVEDEKNDQD